MEKNFRLTGRSKNTFTCHLKEQKSEMLQKHKSLPCQHKGQPKSWIDIEIFTDKTLGLEFPTSER